MRVFVVAGMILWACGCGPTAGSGGGSSGSSGSQPDTQVVGEGDTFVGSGNPSIMLFLDDGGAFSESVFNLNALSPGSNQEQRVSIQIANFGDGLLVLDRIAIEDQNSDGTAKNHWIHLESSETNLTADLPLAIKPHSADISSIITLELVYAPKAFDVNQATFVIESNDKAVPKRSITFMVPALQPEIDVQPKDAFFWFATPVESEVMEFTIHNKGIAPLLVQQVEITPLSNLFTLVEESVNGPIGATGSKGYEPLTFSVRYTPTFSTDGGTATLKIKSTDPGGVLEIPLVGKYHAGPEKSPCLWSWESSQAKVLDFGSVLTGSKTITMSMHNLGTAQCTIQNIGFENDPNAQFYSWKADVSSTNPEEANFSVDSLPAAVSPGQILHLHITYQSSDMGLNSPMVIQYSDPNEKSLLVQAKGGGSKPCIEVSPGSAAAPGTLQFIAQTGGGAIRNFMVYSCGSSGTLTIQSVQAHDAGQTDLPSEFWVVSDPGSGQFKVAAGDMQAYTVNMAAPFEDAELKGVLVLTHLTPDGPMTVEFPLEGLVGADYQPPIANPGTTSDYPGAYAGETLTLDASKSVAGSDEIAVNGYRWSLVSRPPSSSLIVNGSPGPVKHNITPDVSGVYNFALVVKSAGSPALHSAEETVLVVVDEVPIP